jgi:hypothetical protein
VSLVSAATSAARHVARSQGRGCARPAIEGALDVSTSKAISIRPRIREVIRGFKNPRVGAGFRLTIGAYFTLAIVKTHKST